MDNILNPRLIRKQKLSRRRIVNLLQLHSMREDLFCQAGKLNPKVDMQDRQTIQRKVRLLEFLEFNMQREWKFSQDASFHTWWYRIPHCICDKHANDLLFGDEQREISPDCVVHNHTTELGLRPSWNTQ